MSLPFLDKKRIAASLAMKMKEGAPTMEESQEDQDEQVNAIEYCMEDLITAIHNKDAKAAAQAFKDCFDVLDSMPHEEGPHTEE